MTSNQVMQILKESMTAPIPDLAIINTTVRELAAMAAPESFVAIVQFAERLHLAGLDNGAVALLAHTGRRDNRLYLNAEYTRLVAGDLGATIISMGSERFDKVIADCSQVDAP